MLSVCARMHVFEWRSETEKGKFSSCVLGFLCLFFCLSFTHTNSLRGRCGDRGLENKDVCNQELQHRCYDCCFSERLCFTLIVISIFLISQNRIWKRVAFFVTHDETPMYRSLARVPYDFNSGIRVWNMYLSIQSMPQQSRVLDYTSEELLNNT